MKIKDELKLDNSNKDHKFVFYAKHMNNNMNHYEIVLCIEDEQGFRPIDHPDFMHLEQKEAKVQAETMNKTMGMNDIKQNMFIVSSTMRKRNGK